MARRSFLAVGVDARTSTGRPSLAAGAVLSLVSACGVHWCAPRHGRGWGAGSDTAVREVTDQPEVRYRSRKMMFEASVMTYKTWTQM